MFAHPDFSKVSTAHSTRKIKDMTDVLMDKTWITYPDKILYDMYREVHLSDAELLEMKKAQLRYDITVIPPSMLGPEFVKTAGHYHPCPDYCSAEGAEMLSYPEVYQVIRGTATYLLQKKDLSDFIIVEANEGDVVLIPPNYGHVTVNADSEELVMANWVSDAFDSEYEPVRCRAGLAYYVTEDGIAQNGNYDKMPPLSYGKPKSYPEIDLYSGVDMYGLVNDLEKLDFLVNPQNYPDLFKKPFYEC
ncbi:Glucose-6-phosphate isomerase [Methanimicrococcus hongohii]|uniref:glucose-6-phosphate isomerase n=1 Tax=Methanimicrococcus hongohii TaxID=3028295 RepID=A0AA97A2K7_9EURY|nr:glucose-6-phosphate isomerase family protein [Methanimicrococcus sp. Hf6]WNY24173.1 Glucose-6-phosphate isomerase [Methanimicrococcus sp. Hf6]